MLALFTEGGFPMWFLLAFGVGMLVLAARYAKAPTAWALRASLGFAAATLFTTLTGICADLAAVGHHAPDYLKRHPGMTMVEVLLQGFAESMAPGILGFTMLSLYGMVLALGFYRAGKA